MEKGPAVPPEARATMKPDMVTLRSGKTGVQLCPEIGGSIVRFWSRLNGGTMEWLRPVSDGDLARGDPLAMACFSLVPYSNRIRGGRFRFAGREIVLPLNFGDHPHSIHGHGWQAPWAVAEHSDDTAVLEFHHAAGSWPFPYRAR